MDIVLAPDIYVNASVALGSAPNRVVQRVLGNNRGKSKTNEWVLHCVGDMLSALPSFKKEAVAAQIELIRQLVQVIKEERQSKPDAWEEALVSLAKAAEAKRVVTDHPDLLEKGNSEGVEFISSETWLLEQSLPPTPPTRKSKPPPAK